MNLAPIVLFVYNRPEHTRQTLGALSENAEAANSILYIYADGAKENASEEEIKKINETRSSAKQAKGFKEVHLVEAEKNKGLANSVILGTTEVVNKYGSVITLEDDVIVSAFFLEYMNKALNLYKNNPEVFMIGGYNFPVGKDAGKNSSFFLPVTTTQAWGTWKRAWDFFDPVAKGYETLKTDMQLRKKFNFDDSYNYARALINQMETDKINSWAIRWWWSVFKKNGLVLYPDKSLVKNIGWDGSGRHSASNNPFFDKDWRIDYRINEYPMKLIADQKEINRLKNYLKTISKKTEPQTEKNKIGNFFRAAFKKISTFIL